RGLALISSAPGWTRRCRGHTWTSPVWPGGRQKAVRPLPRAPRGTACACWTASSANITNERLPGTRRGFPVCLEVGVEERDVGLRCLDPVLTLGEPVPFVREQDVFHRHVVRANGGDDLVALDLQHARVVGALHDEQRRLDVLRVKQRRDPAVPFAVGGRVAHLVVERFLEGLPPRRNAGQRADPVHYAEYVDADIEDIRLERECGANHVASVGTPDDPDSLAVHPLERREVVPGVNDVLQVHVTMAPVIHVEERLPVTGGATIVGSENGV